MSADSSGTLRDAREVSAAWKIRSHAAESSLIEAFCVSGGLLHIKFSVGSKGLHWSSWGWEDKV